MNTVRDHRVAVLVLDGAKALDVGIAAHIFAKRPSMPYEVRVYGERAGTVDGWNGLAYAVGHDLETLTWAVLGPFQPRAVAVGDPSEAGCQMYASRQDVLSGASGEFLIRPSGESVLFPTGERWAARGGPEFSLNQYVEVSWMAEKASIRDTSGDDANSFHYRGVGTFTC